MNGVYNTKYPKYRNSGTNYLGTSEKHHQFRFLSHCSELTFFLFVKLFAAFDWFLLIILYVLLFGAVFIVGRFYKCLLLLLLIILWWWWWWWWWWWCTYLPCEFHLQHVHWILFCSTDSIYTERYMGLPTKLDNLQAYMVSILWFTSIYSKYSVHSRKMN